MATAHRDRPRIIVISERFYHVLLQTYPAPFRRDYMGQMDQAFRGLCRDAYRRAGIVGVLSLWPAMFGDWFRTMVGEYRTAGQEGMSLLLDTREVTMNQTDLGQQRWRSLSVGLIAAAILTLLLVLYGLVRYPSSIDANTPATVSLIILELVLYGLAVSDLVRAASRAALRAGMFCGLGVGAVWMVYNLDANLGPAVTMALGISFSANLAGLSSAIYHPLVVLSLIGFVALCTAAGLIAAQNDAHIKDGVRAGLLAGLMGSLIYIISMFLSTYPFMHSVLKGNLSDPGFLSSHMHDVTAWTIQDNMGGTFFMLLFGALLGAAFGGLGSLLARGSGLVHTLAFRQ